MSCGTIELPPPHRLVLGLCPRWAAALDGAATYRLPVVRRRVAL